ncbi:MAG: phosphatidate cytidylyltransferase [bacterium]
MLGKRIATAVVLLACCVAGLWFVPHWAWTLGVAAFFSIGAFEWARLTGLGTPATLSIVLAVAASICAPLAGLPLSAVALAWAVSGIAWAMLMPAFLARAAAVRKAALPVGWLVLAPAGAALAWLGHSPWQLLSLLAIVWIADTCAYFAGRAFGRHKLAPSISPGKTCEGVAGGAAGLAVYLAILQASGAAGTGPLAGAAGWSLAVTLTALSVLGDLFESLVKRQAGAKDSGTLLPGHGGVLDRIDGLTSTLPVAALAVYISAG